MLLYNYSYKSVYPCFREVWDLRKIISSNSYYINRDAKMNSRKRDICNVDVHRASYMKHSRGKKHLENIKQNEMIIPQWLFKEPIENKIRRFYNLKPFRQLARDNFI